jgi:hypothetical protein
MKSLECTSKSKVMPTGPSIEFSIGTTPTSHFLFSTAFKTDGIEQ